MKSEHEAAQVGRWYGEGTAMVQGWGGRVSQRERQPSCECPWRDLPRL